MPGRNRQTRRFNNSQETAESDDEFDADFLPFRLALMMAAMRQDHERQKDRETMDQVKQELEKAKECWILNTTTSPKRLTRWQLRDRTQILFEQAARDALVDQMEKYCTVYYSQVALGAPTHCSTTEWRELEIVETGQLEYPNHHQGKVLIGRIITIPELGAGVTFAVEDPSGQAICVTIMHPVNGPTRLVPRETFAAVYPIGGVIAIREPEVRFVLNGGVGIRVEIPSDVVRVHPSDQHLNRLVWKYASPAKDTRNAAAIKESGNRYMAKGQYRLAVCEYTYALACPEDQLDSSLVYALYANRAIANLKSDKPGAAYRDCLRAESLSDHMATSAEQKKKIAWRKAAAAYAMRMWQHAHDLARLAVELGVDQAGDLVKSSASRLREQTGEFDWDAIFRSYAAKQKLDLADYTSPVEVRQSPGKGRGVFLTADVQAGDLLLVEKALVHATKQEMGAVDYFQVNFATDLADGGTHVVAGQKAVHQLMDNTGLGAVWDRLFGSKNKSDRSPFISEADRLEALLSVPDIDVMQLEEIFRMNAYGIPELSVTGNQVAHREERGEKSTTLWATASMFNHSCQPNVSFQSWGEVSFRCCTRLHPADRRVGVVRALHALSAGTELFSCYFPSDLPLDGRRERSEKWGFVCECHLCVADASDNHQMRDRLVEQVLPKVVDQSHGVLRNPKASLAWKAANQDTCRAAERFLMRLEATYAPDRSLKPHLYPLYRILSDHYSHSDLRKAIEADIKALKSIGTIMASSDQRKVHGRTVHELGYFNEFHLVMTMINLVVLHVECRDRAEATSWLKTACWAHQVLVGGGPALFHKRYATAMPKGIPYK